MYAVDKNYLEIVEALFNASADCNIKDFAGNTVYTLAQKSGSANITELLNRFSYKNRGVLVSTFYYLSSPISSVIFSVIKKEKKQIPPALKQNPEELKTHLIAK